MRTVLLIETHAAQREVFRSVLKPRGFEVMQLKHTIDELSHLPSGLELVVVAPVGTNGSSLRLVSHLQKASPELKFVIISHEPVAEWRKRDRSELAAIPEGSVAVLQAPVFPHELLMTIDSLLARFAGHQ